MITLSWKTLHFSEKNHPAKTFTKVSAVALNDAGNMFNMPYISTNTYESLTAAAVALVSWIISVLKNYPNDNIQIVPDYIDTRFTEKVKKLLIENDCDDITFVDRRELYRSLNFSKRKLVSFRRNLRQSIKKNRDLEAIYDRKDSFLIALETIELQNILKSYQVKETLNDGF